MERTHATVCPHNTQIAPPLHPLYPRPAPICTHASPQYPLSHATQPPPPPLLPPLRHAIDFLVTKSPCATTGIVMHLTTQLFVIPNLNMVVQASISLWMRKQTLTGEKSYFVEEKEVLTWYSLLFVWQTVWTFDLLETACSTFIPNVFQFSWTFTS